MFNGRMTQHSVMKPVIAVDEYGNKVVRYYEPYADISAFIAMATHNQYSANAMQLQNITHTALTSARGLAKGMRIDDRYTVEFVNEAGHQTVLYLKELDDGV